MAGLGLNNSSSLPGLLTHGVVHVWRLALDEISGEMGGMIELMPNDERKRADRYVATRDRRRFAAGRVALRLILGNYASCSPAMLQFGYGGAGKPSLQHPPHAQSIQFNLSHSGGYGLLAVAWQQRVGVDVELLRSIPDATEISAGYFSRREERELAQLPESLQSVGFLNCWTRKEAFLKAVGCGFSLSLDSFDVSLIPNSPAKFYEIRTSGESVDKWCITSVPVGDNAVAALVVESPLDGLLCSDWTL